MIEGLSFLDEIRIRINADFIVCTSDDQKEETKKFWYKVIELCHESLVMSQNELKELLSVEKFLLKSSKQEKNHVKAF